MSDNLVIKKILKFLLVSYMSIYGIQQSTINAYAEENEEEITVINQGNQDDSVINLETQESNFTESVEFDDNTVEFVYEQGVQDNLDQNELETDSTEEMEEVEAEETDLDEDISENKMNAVGEDFASAEVVEVGTSSQYNIVKGNITYFKFTPTKSTVYTIESSSSADTYGYLYSSSQTKITEDDDGGNGSNFKFTYFFEAGTTYYVGIKAYSATLTFPYTIVIQEAVTNGTHGNLSWSIDDGVLSVTGTGSMNDMAKYTAAPWYTFKDMIHTVIIGEGITNISKYAFYGLANVTTVSIPSTVTTLGINAFRACTGLSGIYLSSNVTTILGTSYSTAPFYGCNSSMTIYTDADSQLPGWQTYWNYYKSNARLTVIYSYSIQEVSYWDTLDTSQSSIVIPDYVTSIPGGTFENCTNLTSITIPSSVTSIGSNAFKNCTGLKTIYIPSTVTSIVASGNTQSPFYKCSSDLIIYTDAQSKLSGWQTYWNYKDTKEELAVVYNYSADQKNYWENLDYSQAVIEIPEYITLIPDYAFSQKTTLTAVVIPESVTSIGSFAFYGCENLTEVNVPSSVKNIGSYAFANCTNLSTVNLSATITSIKDHTFENCSAIQNFVAPSTVTYIGWGAFRNCTTLTNISLPKGTRTIEESAFEGCFGLRNIYLYRKSSIISFFNDEQYNIIYVDAVNNGASYQLEGYSLSLNNAMGLKFYFTFGLDILEDKDAYVVLDNGQTEEIVVISSTQPEYNGYYGFSANVNVKDLFEPIECSIYAGDDTCIATYTYSANDYLEYILEHEEEYAGYTNIVNSIMNYGITAMKYFGSNSTIELLSNTNEEIDLSAYQAELNANVPFRGARLVLKTQLGMKLYFTSGNEFCVNGVQVQPTIEGEYKVIEIENIHVEDINQFYTITVDGQSMSYCLLSYGYVGLQTENQDLINLIQCLYAYFQSLGQYKTEIEETLTEARTQLETVNTQYAEAEKAISSGILSYFEYVLNNDTSTAAQKTDAQNGIDVITRHSNEKLAYIENPTDTQARNYSTNIGSTGDATSWEKALMVTEEALTLTNQLRNEEGLSSLMTSCYMMATAEVQANASSSFIGHSKLESVAENLYWTYVSVNDNTTADEVAQHLYRGWFVDEKAVYDYVQLHPNATAAEVVEALGLPNESYVQTGHYTNLISNVVTTGFGTNGTGVSNGSGYGYVYSQTLSSNATHAVYTVEEFMSGVTSYYNSIVDEYINAKNDSNRLTEIITKLESTLQTSGFTN